MHWHNEGVLWLFEPTNYTHYTHPATNAYYMMKDMGWSESTRLLKFVPGKTEPELAFDFGVAICTSRGMPSEDERYFYMLVYKGYMTYDKPEWASKPRLVVVDMKDVNIDQKCIKTSTKIAYFHRPVLRSFSFSSIFVCIPISPVFCFSLNL